ncbi:MAG: sensor histidine kinase, partial [Planctomycetota bacterium]
PDRPGLVVLVVFLAAAASRRVQRSRRQDDFVRLVSHELKTPVSSIRMIAETLSLGRVRGEGQEREFLRQLEAESSRLTDLIERLLEHGRQDAARQVKREVVTDPGQLVDEAVTLFRERQAGVGEVLVRSSQVFHPVLIDREAVTGVLLNLLSNAQKFSPPETAIEVTVGEESRHLFIEVSDQGPGIRRRDRRRIFRPFFRGSNGTHQPGFGLGLSYCRQVAEAHKGRIRVVSAPGKGSAFTLEIPLALVAEGEEQDG